MGFRQIISGPINRGVFSRPVKLILPRESLWETCLNACKGWSSCVMDKSVFEEAKKNNVIRESVLNQSWMGSMLTYRLLHHLQNPLWKDHSFDFKDFVEGVGPALESFHSMLLQLGNELPNSLNKDFSLEDKPNDEYEEKIKDNIEKVLKDVTNRLHVEAKPDIKIQFFDGASFLSDNIWRKQAQRDPSSLAGRFAKLTTDDAFDAFYFSAKLVLLGMSPEERVIVEKSKVGEVAILNARAMVVDTTSHSKNGSKINEASESSAGEGVAAQIDILYEITHTYKQPFRNSIFSMEDAYKHVIGKSDYISTNDDSDTPQKQKKYETIQITTIGVASLEGWLSGGPDNDGLRWKVAVLRDADEFPHEPSIKKIS